MYRYAFWVVALTMCLSYFSVQARWQQGHLASKILFADFAPPEVHAASLLDIEGNRIIRPSFNRDINFQLGQVLNALRNSNGGFAIELSPYLLANRELEADSLDETMSGLAISLAWSPSSEAMRYAVGLRYSSNNDPKKDDRTLQIYRARLVESQKKIKDLAMIGRREWRAMKSQLIGFATTHKVDSNLIDELDKRCSWIRPTGTYVAITTSLDSVPDSEEEVVKLLVDAGLATGEEKGFDDVVAAFLGFAQQVKVESLRLLNEIQPSVQDLQSMLVNETWSRPGWSVGAGVVARASGTGTSANTVAEVEYASFYGNVVLPIVPNASIFCFQLRGLVSEANVADITPWRSIQALAQFVLGSNAFRGLLQASGDYVSYRDTYIITPDLAGTNQNIQRLECGLECRLTDGVWMYATSGVRWASNTNASLVLDYGIRYAPTIQATTLADVRVSQ